MTAKWTLNIVLLSTFIVTFGMARADYTTYTQAIDAARPLYAAGDYSGAQRLTEEALTLAKTPSEKVGALMRLGAIYNKRKLNSQARQQWRQVLELAGASNEEKFKAQYLIASNYGEEENWTQLRVEMQKILVMPGGTPSDAVMARFAIAGSFGNQGDEVSARREILSLAQDITVAPILRATAYSGLAQRLLKTKEFDKAYAAFQSAINMPGVLPQFTVLTRTEFAMALLKQGNKDQAQQEFAKAQNLAFEGAKTLEEAKNFTEARSELEAALSVGQRAPYGTPAVLDAQIRMEIAQIFLKENKPQDARGSFEAVLQKTYGPNLKPQDQATLRDVRQSAQLGIAQSYVLQQNKAQAQKVLTLLLTTDALNENVKVAAEKLLQEVS